LEGIDQDEFMVIRGALQWPNKRLSAIEILKLPYFDEVRDVIDFIIPSPPIITTSCGERLINEQKRVTKNPLFTQRYRDILFPWIWSINEKYYKLSRSTLLALVLFDIFIQYKDIPSSKLQLYISVMYYIAVSMYDTRTDAYPILDDMVRLSARAFTKESLVNSIKEVLTEFDFNIIIPSCSDFIFEYLKNTDHQIKYEQASYHAYLLMLNYTYAVDYSQEEIAKLALESIGLNHLPCFNNKPKLSAGKFELYNDTIKQYLIDTNIS